MINSSKKISDKIIFPIVFDFANYDSQYFNYNNSSDILNSKNKIFVYDGFNAPGMSYFTSPWSFYNVYFKSAYITSSDTSFVVNTDHTGIAIPPGTTVINLLSKLTAVNSVAKVYNNAVPAVEVTGNTPVLDGFKVNLFNGFELLGGYLVSASIPTPEFDIRPSIELNVGSSVNVDQPYTVTAKIKNAGENATGINWEVHKLFFKPGVTPNKDEVEDTATAACSYYPHTYPPMPLSSSCSIPPGGGSGIGDYPDAFDNSVYTHPDVVDNLNIGTSVCYILSVKPHKWDKGDTWRHSEMKCMKITKSPKFQVWGGDVRVLGEIKTSTTAKTGSVYGSWSEYGLLSGGLITNTGSAAAFAPNMGGGPLASDNSELSFNNSNSGAFCIGKIGCYYSTAPTAPNIANSFPIIPSGALQTPDIGLNDLNDHSKKGTFTGTGNISLNGGTIGIGRWVVINAPTATITINSNINYSTGSMNKIGDIPQVVIIANKINIAGSVSKIDAWLVATGTDGIINTCSDFDVTEALKENNCKGIIPGVPNGQTLIINGPVIANKIYLRRTYNVDPPVSLNTKPAEIINLRADSYLWSAAQAMKTPRVQTIYTTEAPPRY